MIFTKRYILCCCILLWANLSFAQIGINAAGNTPDPSAMLDVSSTQKGALIPRMTEAERLAIPVPANGLLVYSTENSLTAENTFQLDGFYFYDGSQWRFLGTQLSGGGAPRTNYETPSFTDVIINDYLCVGDDCLTSETLGAATLVVKDGVIVLEFDDTSNSASFPNNHWEIRINEAIESGLNAIAITDAFPGGGGNDHVFLIEAGAGDDALYIDAASNVGMGTNMPGQKLEVAGNMHAEGDITATGSIMQASDKRLKTEVMPIGNGTRLLQQLQPKQYEFRTDDYPAAHLAEGQQYGLIAQEVASVLPELVAENLNLQQADGTAVAAKSVNYTALVPILIQAMQERQQLIVAQRQEIEAVKAQIAELKSLKAQQEQLKAALYDEDGNLNASLATQLRAELSSLRGAND